MGEKLRCSYCSKQFSSEATHKRHLYYCRTRQDNPAPPRRRACSACVAAKARCDLSEPCTRCSLRQVECQYTAAAPKRSIPRRQIDPQSEHTDVPLATSIPHRPTTPPSSPDVSEVAPFAPRQLKPSNGSLHRDLILSMLSTQLSMFRNSASTLHHPLIHRTQQPYQTGTPRATCQVLLQQFASTPPSRHTHLWACVQQESDRMWFDHTAWDDWGLISCLQSLFFYALQRLASSATNSSPGREFDLPFLVSMNQICKAAKARFEGDIQAEVNCADLFNSLGWNWELWLKWETCKRIACLYRTLNAVVDVSDAVSCIADPGYFIMPLPCSDELWMARDEEEWLEILRRDEGQRRVFALSLKGELEFLPPADGEGSQEAEAKDGGGVVSSTKWEDWCAARSHMGYLVRTVAMLLDRG